MKYILPIIAVVALGLSVFNALPNKIMGGQYSTNYSYFNGLTNSGETVLSGSVTQSGATTISGAATLSGGATLSGANVLSGTNTLSGATTITGIAAVSQTNSSTLKIGYNADGLKYGCIVLGDSAGTTSTPVYITATGATISATTTQPTICK